MPAIMLLTLAGPGVRLVLLDGEAAEVEVDGEGMAVSGPLFKALKLEGGQGACGVRA
jgi:hypothetical protein